MRFCDKLPKLRKENNLSQEQLADKIGVSRQAVSKWESGSSYPDMDKMIQICSILNCTLEDLLDDGAIKQDKTPNSISNKNNFNNYFQDFLKFITKSYNMFCSMTFKEKVKCLFEMAVLIGVVAIIASIVAVILNTITSNILHILPNRIYFYLYDLVKTIYITALFILCIIIVIHLFKIRYLDYFVTIEDQNVREKTIEEPIEKIENKHYVQKAKEKIIIRDPKHSTFSFMNLLGKCILYMVKFFALMFLIFVIFFFIFFIFLGIMSLCHIQYGILFFYLLLAMLGVISIAYILIEFLYRFIFDIKQRLNTLFILFVAGLVLIGVGSGLACVTFINYDYEKGYSNFKTKTATEYLEVDENTYIYFGTTNVEFIIDNSLNNVKLEITYLEDMKYHIGYTELMTEEEENSSHYSISLNSMDPLEFYQFVLKDIKNKKIRSYDNDDFMKIKVYLSQEKYNTLNNNNSIVY